MLRRLLVTFILALVAALAAGCHRNKVANPIANVNSKQPDKVLFDRAMDAMQHGKYDVARMTLQTLINTYPDSEFIARAKLAVGDSWYAEGTTAAYAQAEEEYSQFQVFFPNMAEAAEAQKKIGDIHYKQMEKADRDPTQALKAEDAYRQLVLQYPDSKLVPEAKERLREVQEVLADREYGIGHFYFVRGSYTAAIARLKTLADTYPLYSQVDEALFLLGNAYERQAGISRNARMPVQISNLPAGQAKDYNMQMWKKLTDANIAHFDDLAAQTYSRLVSQYPVMDRAKEARERLEALHHAIPEPTQEAIARNKAEQESRRSETMFQRFMDNLHHGPSMASAARVGDPTIEQPPQTNATDVLAEANDALKRNIPALNGGSEAGGEKAGTEGGGEKAGTDSGTAAPAAGTSGGATGAIGVQPLGNGSSGSTAQPAVVQPSPQPAPPPQPAPAVTQPAAGEQPRPQAQPDNGIEELKPITPPATTPAPGTGGNSQPAAQIHTGITSQDTQTGTAAQQQQQQQQAAQPAQNSSDQASSKNSKKKKKKDQQQQPPPPPPQ
ncbi:MAG: outer membrane protein assembly factor BamD [Acidobacteria bacterium]|nr:outer membrane protein assembly factor BamD [Acidobacteriota bacterium]